MGELWFEEELIAPDISFKPSLEKFTIPTKLYQRAEEQKDKKIVLGTVRVNKPDWDIVTEDLKPLRSGKEYRYYLVRLGFEFYIANEFYVQGARFNYAYCGAYIWPKKAGEKNPRIYDIIPKDLYEGNPHTVTVKLGPEIKLGQVGGKLGEISSDLMTGRVTPTIVGYTGEDERAPYWELRPTTRELTGIQHLWLVIELPKSTSGIRLAAIAAAVLQTMLGPIPIGPKETIWENRPSIVIE